jgi:hypothetical protein
VDWADKESGRCESFGLREIRALGERVGWGSRWGMKIEGGFINSSRNQKSQRAKPNKYDLETRAIIAVGSGGGIDGRRVD